MAQAEYMISVGLETLRGGYRPILDYYNLNRPEGSQPLCEAGVCEGGFEIPLSKEELALYKNRGLTLDPNRKVRQLRWNKGELVSMGYQALTQEETILLYHALCYSLGNENVNLYYLQ